MCGTVHLSFPASAYCMVLKALWFVVVLVKQPSLGVGVIVYVCVCVREREHSRGGDVCCLSASAGLNECALCTC